MKHWVIAAALCLSAAPAFAFHCPKDMAEIDAALAAGASLSQADMARVKALRAEGEARHKAGDHAGSVAVLGEAKMILGLE